MQMWSKAVNKAWNEALFVNKQGTKLFNDGAIMHSLHS